MTKVGIMRLSVPVPRQFDPDGHSQRRHRRPDTGVSALRVAQSVKQFPDPVRPFQDFAECPPVIGHSPLAPSEGLYVGLLQGRASQVECGSLPRLGVPVADRVAGQNSGNTAGGRVLRVRCAFIAPDTCAEADIAS